MTFKKCQFSFLYFSEIYNCYHEFCKFTEDVLISPSPKVTNKEGDASIKYRYISCTFENNVSLSPSGFSREVHCNIFSSCSFEKNISINNLKINKNLFLFPDPLNEFNIDSIKQDFNKIKNCYKINSLSIKNCIFESDFRINGLGREYIENLKFYGCEFGESILTINSLEIIDTKFDSKVEIKYRVIEDFKFFNSNVAKVFDSFESRFEQLYFYKSIFTDFAGFEKAEFGLKGKDIEKYQAKFIYTTFMSFSNFRYTKFLSGLDFENSNLKEQPNFLKTDISSKNTNRETFRIIKHSFDTSGNKIEANRFFVKEMQAYRKEVSKEKKCSERFIFFMNGFLSEFGGSYFKPILLLIILFEMYIIALSYVGLDLLPSNILSSLDIANSLTKEFLLYSLFLRKDFEFISLVFYILSVILIWQIVVSIKRHTQR